MTTLEQQAVLRDEIIRDLFKFRTIDSLLSIRRSVKRLLKREEVAAKAEAGR